MRKRGSCNRRFPSKGDGEPAVWTGANSQGSLLSPRGSDKGHHQTTP